jgi:hypothetical protein
MKLPAASYGVFTLRENKGEKFLTLPFHAAEQRSKKQKNDSAEHLSGSATFRGVCFVRAAQAAEGQVNGCPFFWFVFFGQTKKMNGLKNTALVATP